MSNLVRGRSARELLIAASLASKWPFDSDDTLSSACMAIDRMKVKHTDLWVALNETTTPAVTADCVVDVMLSTLTVSK